MSTAQVYPWAQALWQRLLRQHAQQRLPHALLMSGHAGIGKLAFAQALAQYLLCQHPHQDTPCGQCRSCQLFAAEGHPDCVLLFPEEAGKVLKIDQIRELTEFLHATAQQGGYRVVILEPAEAMTLAAANALLKSLEEPGNNTLLVLVSHQPGQLMPTIRSRCQRIDFPAPSPLEANQWLQSHLGLTAQRAEQLLSIAGGAPLKAQRLQESQALPLRAELMKGLADLLKGRCSVVELSVKLHKEDLLQLLEWLQSLLADIARLQLVGEAAQLSNLDMTKMLSAVAKKTTVGKLFQVIDHLQMERISLMERYNPNRQLLLEGIFMRWIDLVR
ncbi:DNA polymerase III subunit delta' [Nitrincola tapanii]|uniref:DNA polymerase III subunit delta' n=1 Tax=Nitrincola tapanii TaxID=1708751 RepID=A0A5A9W4K4_9GAMM|nr:DNA polymerase III subunit delta' [Nitrincola tapanii]KAA0875453.1 DNA polymerase III subunit delta' [Nitrincola tapanii]